MNKWMCVRSLFLFSLLLAGHAWAGPAGHDPLLLAQADASKAVVMYATSWCPYCQRAREHFRARGIPYVEYDIEKDEAARRAYKAFGGRGIPVIFVGKRRMNGFSREAFDRLYP